MKTCTRCEEIQPLESFNRWKHGADGRQAWCRVCQGEHAAAKAREACPNHRAEQYRMQTYGVQPAEQAAMYADQDGRCGICRRPIPYNGAGGHLDHDHATGQVRGFLMPAV